MPQFSGTYNTPRLDLGVALNEYPLTQPGFIGLQVLPVFDTQKKTADFTTVTRESILRARNVKRAPKSAYARDDHELSAVQFSCEEYGYEQLVDDSERALYVTDYDADLTASQLARDVLLREQEKRIASAIFNTTTFTGASLYTDLGTDWDNAAATIASDVITARETVRNNCGLAANTVIIPHAALSSIMGNTDMKSRMQYIQILNEQNMIGNLPAIFGVDRVLVAGGVYNSADEGATLSIANCWSALYCWVGVTARTNNLAEPCIGRTMAWVGDGGQFTVEQYREEQTRTDVFRVRQHVDELIIDANFGHLLKIDT